MEVQCLTDEIRADAAEVPLAHGQGAGGRIAGNLVGQGAGERPTATGLEVRVGSIKAETTDRRARIGGG